MIGVVLFLGVMIAAVNFLLSSQKATAQKDITQNQAKVSGFATVQTNATQFRTGLTRAKTLLDGNVDYAKAITQTAKLLPAGTVLTSYKLDETSFGKPMVLTVEVKGESEALALRSAFQSSQLYSNVSFGKLSTNSSGDSNAYPYTIDLNVTINKAGAQ